VYSIVVQNNIEAVMAELQCHNPLLLETIDMSLEDIFIYQMGGLGYEFTQLSAR
jgi:ABC-2 type transport system ATP-binding protein